MHIQVVAMKSGESTTNFFNTKLLYTEDCYIREFEAEVIKSGPKYVILNQTAFYPEGGGQPSDTGVLRFNKHELDVKMVKKRGKDVFHHLNGDIPVGTKVYGRINWEPRFDNMRRHSGEHLLTGLFTAAGSGPKTYSDLTRMEFKPSELTEETVREVETQFNSLIEKDLPLKTFFTSREELKNEDDPRKRSFLYKIPRGIDELRMVEIPGHSLVFCFGTHVKNTGDIGKLKEITLIKGKKGRRTVTFLLE